MLGIYKKVNLNNLWDSKEYFYLKKSIKELLISKKRICSYCRIPFPTGGKSMIMIHLEHILPKKEYQFYTFFIKNLCLSCQRCNMSCKGRRKDHIVNFSTGGIHNIETDFLDSNYKILHPNIDKIDDYYILKLHFLENGEYFYHYQKKMNNNPRLDFTFDFFKLDEIESDYIDNIQNLEQDSLKREDYGLDKLI